MTDRVERAGLQVARELATFIEGAALPGTGVGADQFWDGLAGIVSDLGPENRVLLARRDQLQSQIDDWHIAKAGQPHDAADYRHFLDEIGYIVPEPPDFTVQTEDLDTEIATLSGPQLVVPITNARFALNAANARWGSLYDALYGTDALGDRPAAPGHDSARAARVVAWVRAHLDAVCPLSGASWSAITAIRVDRGQLRLETADGPVALADPGQFAGWLEGDIAAWQILLRVNGLLIEILVDPSTPLGAVDKAGISDVWVEAALSTIMDFEDSVAVVDAEDKVQAYGNWLGLMRGDLTEAVTKNGETFVRKLNPDAEYDASGGGKITVRCRSLLLCRNVGHLMTTPAVLDRDGAEIGEGFLDAMVTVLCAMHDRARSDGPRNATHGAVYIVKPKMHGPDEVEFACTLFARVESALGLPVHTVKLGLMDEERRTSVNLRACIAAAKDRIFFVNTGFLDRTGDEIHTAMEAGPVVPKDAMRTQAWIAAYEDRNVDIALATGLAARGQVGKGMWTRPDDMAAMLADKIAHPRAGASCAWVPSPVAATLHATHYHLVDVKARQAALSAGGMRGKVDDLLALPLIQGNGPTADAITAEVENDAQGILGYVVRWIDQGIGCSKVPDINDVALMEDRATCRISAQGLANWLHHGLVSEADVLTALHKMALVVDRQNAGDPAYVPMAPAFDGLAFQAACDLVFKGRIQPSGYTEPVLHRRRIEQKARLRA
jgi:malate synthase